MAQLNVVTFGDVLEAQEFLLAMVRQATNEKLHLQDAVFVTKSEDGRVRVHETNDPTTAQSAAGGGFWGLILGTLLLGPIGGLAAGAISAGGGALLGKLVDLGITDEFIKDLKTHIGPGRTALALLTEDGETPVIETELERFPDATLVYSNLPADAHAAVTEAVDAGEAHDDVQVTADGPDTPWPQRGV